MPRKGGVCLDLSYMGLLHLAQSSGVILWGQCKIVRANDTYQNAGLSKEPNHLSNTFGDRGEIVGAYCTVKTIDGDYLTEEMSIKKYLIFVQGLKHSKKAMDRGKLTKVK